MHPPDAPVNQTKGKQNVSTRTSLMNPSPFAVLSHPFGSTLAEWAKGVPVDCGPNWDQEEIDLAIARGPHPTAREADAIALVHEDVNYQVQAGFTEIVLWADIKDKLPPSFKISPVAVVPQTGRRGRIILDLSFAVRRLPTRSDKRKMGKVVREAVNKTTTQLAPQLPVKAIGQVLPRLFEFMALTPAEEEVRFSKIDLSDGFWRMIVEEQQKYNFCYVMPDPPGAPIRIVVPSALQMGWAESPAYFCAATETSRDIIHWLITEKIPLPPHPMEAYMKPGDSVPRCQTTNLTEEYTESLVYVDDFIIALVENANRTLIQRVSRAALFGIHAIFPPPSISGHAGGKDPISQKKLEKGDASFTVEKLVLGFLLNGRDRTVTLPADKAAKILQELKKVLHKKKVNLKRFQSLVGKLRHVAQILPSAKGIFTPINNSLSGNPKEIGLGTTSEVRSALLDLGALVRDLAKRPTHVCELVPDSPRYAGTSDAAAQGAGGVWFGPDIPPTVWRLPFPQDIQDRLVSGDNPKGDITNSDLELAGVLIQHLILEQLVPLRRTHIAIRSDNTPTVAWVASMSSKSKFPTAGRLIRALAMRQRVSQSAPAQVGYIPGPENTLADLASRSFQLHPTFSMQDTAQDGAFLSAFSHLFPLPPQHTSWQLAHLTPELSSLVISTLRGQRSNLQQWTMELGPQHGTRGQSSVKISTKTPTSEELHLEPPNTSWWLSLPACVQVFSDIKNKSDVNRWKKPFGMPAKTSFWPDTPTQESLQEEEKN
jgi:hypothetical protein